MDGCSLLTSLSVLTIGCLVFGWVSWEPLTPPATSGPEKLEEVEVTHKLYRF